MFFFFNHRHKKLYRITYATSTGRKGIDTTYGRNPADAIRGYNNAWPIRDITDIVEIEIRKEYVYEY